MAALEFGPWESFVDYISNPFGFAGDAPLIFVGVRCGYIYEDSKYWVYVVFIEHRFESILKFVDCMRVWVALHVVGSCFVANCAACWASLVWACRDFFPKYRELFLNEFDTEEVFIVIVALESATM
eukprot:scaffold133307_cov46-Attheya_sp.AAC.1